MIADERTDQEAFTKGKVLELHPRHGASVALRNAPATVSEPELDSEKLFRLEVMVDLQRERELLYKVALVIEAIAALMLLREWALWWLA